MKTYEASFWSHHFTLSNRYVEITFQARDLEAALSRVKKELRRLETLPNPQNHSVWNLGKLKEKVKP